MKKGDLDFKTLPDEPGVYRFVAKSGEVLYVGKATSLRDRVKSYFVADLAEVRSPLIEKVVGDAVRVEWEECDSVLDALILEAKRIQELKPVGNTDRKDDKSWNYLVVTNETYPRFLITRERKIATEFSPQLIRHLFGPFPHGSDLKEALKIVRKIFPFFDTPFKIGHRMSDLSKAQQKIIAFNQSIGKYPAFDEGEYRKTVKFITLLFEAKKKTLLKQLERDMKRAAKEERFEDAVRYRHELFALEHIQDVTLIKEELKAPMATEFRIEAYDTAHMRGAAPRGVMVVVTDGEVQRSQYRTFTIRGRKKIGHPMSDFKGDDYAALDEIISRRARHPEWPFPKLVVIDGGRAHLARAKHALGASGIHADVVAVVKDERHRPREILGPSTLIQAHEPSILLANAEAHRFAIGRHRSALRKR